VCYLYGNILQVQLYPKGDAQMSRYVLIFTGGGMPETEEEQAAVMAAWGAWYEKLGAAVADPGNAFSPAAMNVVPGGAVSAGAIGTPATGFTVVSADSIESAVAMAKECPILNDNGQVTVYEGIEM
jgi:hypothetical protein